MTQISFTCPNCNKISNNPRDALCRYCGSCHLFWGDIEETIAFVKMLGPHAVDEIKQCLNDAKIYHPIFDEFDEKGGSW